MSQDIKAVEAGIEGFFDIPQNRLLGEDQTPIPKAMQTWGWSTFFFTTMGIAFNIILIMQGALIILFGCNWQQDLIIMVLSAVLLGLLFALNGDIGRRFGVPHSVQLRSVFGVKAGSYLVGGIRAIVALFFFGIQSWIVAMCLDGILSILFSGWVHIPKFSRLLILFVVFSGVQYIIMFYGYKAMQLVAVWGMPLCIIMLFIALAWMYHLKGTWGPVWQKGSALSAWGSWKSFLTGFAMEFGSWATLIINFSDLTRVAKIDSKQLSLAGILGFSVGMILAAIIGMTTLSLSMASGLGKQWNPVVWVDKFPNPAFAIVILLLILFAQLTTNPQANMLSPATTLSNIFTKLNIKSSSLIMIAISLFTCPWVFLSHTNTMMAYLSNVGAILAGAAAIMIVDYWIVRRKQINFLDLYNQDGIYQYWSGGINWLAIISVAASVILGYILINDGGTFISGISGSVIYLVLIGLLGGTLKSVKKSLAYPEKTTVRYEAG